MPNDQMMRTDPAGDGETGLSGPLIVVPCLNESAHIGPLLRQLVEMVRQAGGRIVVVDGGSDDGTQEIVRRIADGEPLVSLLHNPAKIQSAGVNDAVEMLGEDAEFLIRIDAHCSYSDDYVETLISEARRTGADSVVVGMIAEGTGGIQRINAVTQNSRVGNGGSSHRARPKGGYVEHGHHALMRISAFRDVGGYDPTFTHNEDAELDHRLRRAGHRIWLTPETVVTYHPRDRIGGLLRQYFNHGRGRAQNMRKHGIIPAPRQAKVMLVLPAVLMLGLVPLHPALALPALIWGGYCLVEGSLIALRKRAPSLALTGPVAMLMHLAWSTGFWSRILAPAPVVPAERAA